METFQFSNKNLVSRKAFFGKLEQFMSGEAKPAKPMTCTFQDLRVVHANPLHDCVEAKIEVTLELKDLFTARLFSPIEGFRFGNPEPEEFSLCSPLDLTIEGTQSGEKAATSVQAFCRALEELGYSRNQ